MKIQQDCSDTTDERVPNIFHLGGRMGVTDYIDFLRNDEVPKNMLTQVKS